RWVRNVRFLFVDNALWPESMHHDAMKWRGAWYRQSRAMVLSTLCPLALVGIGACVRRPTTTLVVSAAHVVTMRVVAAFFFAEQRYRVPYDMFLWLLALEGGRHVLGLWKKPEEKPAQKPEQKPEQKAEPKPEPEPKPETETKTEPETNSQGPR